LSCLTSGKAEGVRYDTPIKFKDSKGEDGQMAPSGHHWAVVLEWGGVWDQLALSSSAETKTQRDSSQQIPPHHSTQLTTF